MIQVHAYVLLSLYGLLFVSLVLCLTLFISLKRENRRSEVRMKRQQIHLQEAYDRLEAGMEKIKAGLRDVDDKTSTFVAPSPTKSGLNVNKRSQATRMFRRGDPPDQIATALGVPRSEVLLKVQESTLAASAN
jgi:hypothetical protein